MYRNLVKKLINSLIYKYNSYTKIKFFYYIYNYYIYVGKTESSI